MHLLENTLSTFDKAKYQMVYERFMAHTSGKDTNTLNLSELLGLLNDVGLCEIFNLPETNRDTIDYEHFVILLSILAYHLKSPDYLLMVIFHYSGVVLPFHLYANDELKSIYMAELISCKSIGAHLLTESSSGSDLSQISTSAKRQGNHYIINGKKNYICNAQVAHHGLLYCNAEANNIKSLMSCWVNLKQDCITIAEPLDKIGLNHVLMNEVTLTDAIVNVDHVLAAPGQGLNCIMVSTTLERLLIPMMFLGRVFFLHDTYLDLFNTSNNKMALAEIQLIILNMSALLNYVISQVQDKLWDYAYIKLASQFKILFSRYYLDVTQIIKSQLREINSNQDLSEHTSALAATIYSGTNDALLDLTSNLGFI